MTPVDRGDLLALLVAGDVARLRGLLTPMDGMLANDVLDLPHRLTPMMAAAACGNEAAVELLLQCGADPARRDAAGRTAAAYARSAGHPHLAARLDTVVDQERRMW
jgi:ankyrin repeat protein